MAQPGPLEERYETLARFRDPFMQRAFDYAELTIPSLFPRNPGSHGTRLPEPYQGFGAMATSNLANRIVTALLPPGNHSFIYKVPAQFLLKNQQMNEDKTVSQGLALARDLASSEIERRGWREPTMLEMLLLIITGNALEQVLPDNRIKVYRLNQYVLVRDPEDNLVELITREKLSPEYFAALTNNTRAPASEEYRLFTRVHLDPTGQKFIATQEANGVPVGEERTWPRDELPFNALRWGRTPEESYGRAKVEEHIGDFRALEGYSKSMVDGAAMAARHIWAVAPNSAGGNLRQRLAKAKNGDVLAANPDDVAMLQFQNVGGLQVVQAEKLETLRQLSAAFLMGPDRVRQAERVTAAEIRMLAEELEGVLGGVYTMLSQSMQRARVRVLTRHMIANKALPPWPEGMVEPETTTGLEALGQEQVLVKLSSAIQLAQGLDPQGEYVKTDVLLSKGYNALGFTDSVRTEAEAQQVREQRAALMAAQSAAGNMDPTTAPQGA